MRLIFTHNAWKDYLNWQEADKKMVAKINELIKEIRRTPYEGKGKPEPLKFDMTSLWSRGIDRKHRLVYQVLDEDILIYSCRYHYSKEK